MGKRSWGEYWPRLKTQRTTQTKEMITRAQLIELREWSLLRSVDLNAMVRSRFGVAAPQWLFRLQAKELIEELKR